MKRSIIDGLVLVEDGLLSDATAGRPCGYAEAEFMEIASDLEESRSKRCSAFSYVRRTRNFVQPAVRTDHRHYPHNLSQYRSIDRPSTFSK